jgi:hypothetical protein
MSLFDNKPYACQICEACKQPYAIWYREAEVLAHRMAAPLWYTYDELVAHVAKLHKECRLCKGEGCIAVVWLPNTFCEDCFYNYEEFRDCKV